VLYCWAQELLTFCVFCDDLFWVSEAVSFSYLGVLSQILYVYLYHHYCNRTQHILCKYGYSLLAGISDWWPVIFTNQLTVFCDLTSPILPLGTFGLFSVPVHVSSLSLYAYSSTLCLVSCTCFVLSIQQLFTMLILRMLFSPLWHFLAMWNWYVYLFSLHFFSKCFSSMYRKFLFILALSVCSCPRIFLDVLHSVSCCFEFASFSFSFLSPTECSKSPWFGKCLGKLIEVSPLSVLLLWNLAFRNMTVKLNQQSFLKHNGTQSHLHMYTVFGCCGWKHHQPLWYPTSEQSIDMRKNIM